MKVHQLLLLAGATTCASSVAFGFAEIGRGELLLSTTARAAYDSRILGGLADSSDYVFTLDPQLIYRREAAQIKLEAMIGTRINRYADFTEFNSEDLESSVKFFLPQTAATLTSGSWQTNYDEHNEVNYDVNRRVREKSFSSQLSADVPIGLKTALLLGGGFRRDNRNHFSDQESRTGTIGFRYLNFLGGTSFDLKYRRLELESSGDNEWAIPLDQHSDTYTATISRPIYNEVRGSVSYGYRVLHRSSKEVFGGDTTTGGSIFSVDLIGPFLPRSMFPQTDSSISFGYEKSETPGINERGSNRFVGTARVGWHPRERTRLFVNARRAVELTVNDTNVVTTGVNVGLTQEVGNFTKVTLSGGYEKRDYAVPARKDDVWLGSAVVSYKITRAWSADATYQIRASDSTLPTADYSREIIAISANYTF